MCNWQFIFGKSNEKIWFIELASGPLSFQLNCVYEFTKLSGEFIILPINKVWLKKEDSIYHYLGQHICSFHSQRRSLEWSVIYNEGKKWQIQPYITTESIQKKIEN